MRGHGRNEPLSSPWRLARSPDFCEGKAQCQARRAPNRRPRRPSPPASRSPPRCVRRGMASETCNSQDTERRTADDGDSPPARRPPASELTSPSKAWETEFRLAEQHCQDAIAKLEQAARSTRSIRAETRTRSMRQTAAMPQKNLQVIDQAIAESRAALRSRAAERVEQAVARRGAERLRPQRRPALGDGLVDDLQVLLQHRRGLRIERCLPSPGRRLVEPRRLFELRDRVLVMLLGQLELCSLRFRRQCPGSRCPGRRRRAPAPPPRGVFGSRDCVHAAGPIATTTASKVSAAIASIARRGARDGFGNRRRLHPAFLSQTSGDLHPDSIGRLERFERIGRADRLAYRRRSDRHSAQADEMTLESARRIAPSVPSISS